MERLREALQQPAVICFILANVVFLLLLAARHGGALVPLELISYDQMLRSRPDAAADSRIVLIEETEEDIHRYGYPLSDEKLAAALERLTAYHARAIGVDIYRDIPVAPGEARLASILKRNPNIIWVSKFSGDQRAVAPPRVLVGTEQVGFNDLIDDPGGIVRRGMLFLDDGKTTAYSLPLRLALHYLEPLGLGLQPDPANPDHVRLGRTTIVPFEKSDGGYINADAAGYQFLLDFGDMPGRHRSFALAQLLNGQVDASAIKDKIVLIGSAARSINDYFYTPYSVGLGADQRMFGVELHAHITNQLLRFSIDGQPQIKVISDSAESVWIWLWCIAAGFVALIAHSIWRFLGASLLVVLALVMICHTTLLHWHWIPFIPPVVGFLTTGALAAAYLSAHEKKQRGVLMQLFSKHVSADVAEALWRDRELFLEGGRPRSQQLTATVLSTDIKGFTTVSEKLDPTSLLQWLNEYMGAMARQVIRHHGLVDKYIGDAIMAVFGVPVARKTGAEVAQDAINAVKCALAMEQELMRMNLLWRARGMPVIGMRAGIYTGPLVAGSLGSADRLEYTVIGDTVNTAFRLESYDKNLVDPDFPDRDCRILIGDSTRSLLGNLFVTRPVGEVSLKGKDQKVSVYYVVKQLEEVT